MKDVKIMSKKELEDLLDSIQGELARRKEVKKNELISNLCVAYNELIKEFPCLEFIISYRCDECDFEGDIDLFDYIPTLDGSYFQI